MIHDIAKGKHSIQPCTAEIHLQKIYNGFDHHLWILSIPLIWFFKMGDYSTVFNTNKLLFTSEYLILHVAHAGLLINEHLKVAGLNPPCNC